MNYKQGWNDRVTGAGGEHGMAYRGGDGGTRANAYEARTWTASQREAYVRGWTDAKEKLAVLLETLVIVEENGQREGARKMEAATEAATLPQKLICAACGARSTCNNCRGGP